MRTRTAFAVLKGIGSSEAAFSLIGGEVERAAASLVHRLLHSRRLTVAALRAAYEALGSDTFEALIDNLSDKEIHALARKLDGHWPELSTAASPAQRVHVLALATGRSTPSPRTKRRNRPKIPSGLPGAATWPGTAPARDLRG
jgi:hypothetical protein